MGLMRGLVALAGLLIGGVVTASLALVVEIEFSTPAEAEAPPPRIQNASADDNDVSRSERRKPPVQVSRRKIYGNIETERVGRGSGGNAGKKAGRKFDFLGPGDEPERRARPGQGTPMPPLPPLKPAFKQEISKPKPPPPAPKTVASLPKKAPTARQSRTLQPPWRRYAVASPANSRLPMIALVLDDVGLSQYRADKVVALQRPITVAILPYGHQLRGLSARVRAAGHEVIVHLPMEPHDPEADPGPKALLTNLDKAELHKRLNWNLEQFGSYVGVSNHMGSRLTSSKTAMELVMREVKDRGLLFLDSVTSERSVGLRTALRMGVPAASRDIFIDAKQDRAFIRRQLAAAEKIARKTGFVVAIGHPYPETLSELEKWLPGLRNKGFLQVPISAIVQHRRAG